VPSCLRRTGCAARRLAGSTTQTIGCRDTGSLPALEAGPEPVPAPEFHAPPTGRKRGAAGPLPASQPRFLLRLYRADLPKPGAVRQFDPPGVACRDLLTANACSTASVHLVQLQQHRTAMQRPSISSTTRIAVVDQHLRAVTLKQFRIGRAIGRPVEAGPGCAGLRSHARSASGFSTQGSATGDRADVAFISMATSGWCDER